MTWSPSESAIDYSQTPSPQRRHHVPRSAGRFGMILFLVSLSVLFAASLLGFLLIRFFGIEQRTNEITGNPIAPTAPPLGQIDLPKSLWLSTGIILISSLTIHRALRAVRRERQKNFRQSLILTLGLAGAFLLIQTPALVALLINRYGGEVTAIYGLIFTLILIHALHVIGGIVPLSVITRRAFQGNYDHEFHQPVSNVVMYWHFLDAVWLVMFITLMIGQ